MHPDVVALQVNDIKQVHETVFLASFSSFLGVPEQEQRNDRCYIVWKTDIWPSTQPLARKKNLFYLENTMIGKLYIKYISFYHYKSYNESKAAEGIMWRQPRRTDIMRVSIIY